MNKKTIKQLLRLKIPSYLIKVENRLINTFYNEYKRINFKTECISLPNTSETDNLLLHLIEFIQIYIQQQIDYLASIERLHAKFTQRLSRAVTLQESQQHILSFAKSLGASKKQLAADRQAFKRWFGQDTVSERYQRRRFGSERMIAFCLDRLGVWCASLLENTVAHHAPEQLWRRLDIEPLVQPLLTYDGDSRVRIAAFRCLVTALKQMPENLQETVVSDGTLQYVYRASLNSNQDVWIQCEALSTLESLSRKSLKIVLHKRLTAASSGDDLFVRRHAVHILCRNRQHLTNSLTLIESVLHDPSPAVRQALAESLVNLPHLEYQQPLRHIICHDEIAAVRATALLQVPSLLDKEACADFGITVLNHVFIHEKDEFVLRVALQTANEGYLALIKLNNDTLCHTWQQALLPAIEQLHGESDSLSVRRWAAQTREKIWSNMTIARRALKTQLHKIATTIPPGSRKSISRRWQKEHGNETVGRMLSVLAQEGYGYDLAPGWLRSRLMRGHKFGFRTWRIWHEFRNPSTDKRQAFPHTRGRIFYGAIRAPSAILSELAETKVPGEPLYMSSESGWRPYLPLVDDMISVLDYGLGKTPTQFYTSEGITQVSPPQSLIRKIYARTALTRRFAYYARLRNHHDNSNIKTNTYINELKTLGFDIQFSAYPVEQHQHTSIDSNVQRYFTPLLPFSSDDLWSKWQDYFVSVYENSMTDLVLFLSAISSVFIGRHLYINRQLRHTRKSIPLVIGGWGTRGKSGTERLKAALINALGYSVVSKTTGCEAMFLHAPPFGKLREMFLFRPYDKATIWEQGNVLHLADKLNTDVFLWECMALTPSYVTVLQQQWVRDDIATITNTYPDHEDLQGPAGINIPEVMTEFIPDSSLLLTSEEQMLPLLQEAANKRNTRTETVGWLQAGLITPDLLQRFPYEEHPYNIALVLQLAQELGVSNDFAIKAMADRVVLDLGVLKSYPVAPMRTRQLEFINGMSANERFGCLNNWQRMNFVNHDWQHEPNIWLTTVINNRVDRIARSKVFSDLIVEELHADRHFVIGTNVDGFFSYLQQAWKRHTATITLWPKNDGNETIEPLTVLKEWALRLRIPFSKQHILEKLKVMLSVVNDESFTVSLTEHWQYPEALHSALKQSTNAAIATEIITHLRLYLQQLQEYESIHTRITNSNDQDKETLDQEFQHLLWQWFERKIVILEDSHMSGDQIIEKICSDTPPGVHNRIMGLQNIKGTGLDFVYRWQAWDTCHNACQLLLSTQQASRVEQGLHELVQFRDFGLLSEEFVLNAIENVRHCNLAQNETFQAQLQVIDSNLKTALAQIKTRTHSQSNAGILSYIAEAIESFLDAGDAVKRRKRADKIYKDLVHERISHELAANELQKLNKRQKGGWLTQQLHDLLSSLRKRIKIT
ncbi:MAG: hypothetical protein GXP08_16750 [Gammaproteobacteria bacterium]|nr:hypothetical protein [Gammaproteobacteria bacterium]